MTADTRLTRTKIPDLNGPGFYYPEYWRHSEMLPPKNYLPTSAATQRCCRRRTILQPRRHQKDVAAEELFLLQQIL